MSSYNAVTKIAYSGSPTDLVTLNEYIMFQDDKAKRKYLIFKFKNNVTQQLLGMQFEVCQFNADGDLIEKSIVIYDKFLASAEEEFVPKAKLRVSYYCASIQITLMQAAFDRFIWKEGEYEDNSYKFDHFFHDEMTLKGDEKKDKKPEKVKKSKEKKPKKDKKKKKFSLKDATRKNLAKFPVVYYALVFIIIIAFVATTVLLFKRDGTKFSDGDYNLRIVTDGEVAICGYTGKSAEVVIPETIGEYTVTTIDGGAFKNSKISAVVIDGSVVINGGAFVSCASLTSVKAAERVTVKSGAFQNCFNLSTVNLPASILAQGSFVGCTSLSSGSLTYANAANYPYALVTAPVD